MALVDLHRAAEMLTQLREPTLKDYEDYFAIARKLPVPDFGEQFDREKKANTPRYRAVVAEANALLGLTSNKTPAKSY